MIFTAKLYAFKKKKLKLHEKVVIIISLVKTNCAMLQDAGIEVNSNLKNVLRTHPRREESPWSRLLNIYNKKIESVTACNGNRIRSLIG